MNKLIILFLLAPIFSFSQEIIGLWANNLDSDTGLEFKADGTFNLIDLKNPNTNVLRNLTVTYKLLEVDGETYISFNYYHKEKLVQHERIKYKFEDEKLHLPRTITSNGVKTVEDYADEYIRLR